MDYKKSQVSHSKNLGSAQQYLSQVGDDDSTNKFIPTENEKITYIN